MENAILEGFRIGYKNFSGKPDQFNREGDRNFVVFLDEETADILEKDGWNVKRPKPSPDPEVVREPYLPIKVNFNGRPPTVVTITNKGATNENMLRHTEDTVSSITGVFRERLGGIEARDAVHNVEIGMQQSYVITKRYYRAMDTLVKEILSDCIDMAKVVFKEGMTGQLILGDQKEIFTLLPEYYSFTSYDISLADSAEIIKEQEAIKQIAQGYMQSNLMDPEVLFTI